MKVEHGGHMVRVAITFPSHYPNGAAPFFIFDTSTSIDITSQQELNKVYILASRLAGRLVGGGGGFS